MHRFVLRLCAIGAATASTAHGQVVKDFQFDVDGVLPSADPEIVFFTTTGAPEASIFSVSGGLLHQAIPGSTGVSTYNWPDVAQTLGTLDPGKNLIVEARLRVPSSVGIGAFVQVIDGAQRYQLMLQAGSALVLTTTGTASAPVDIAQFHTFRIESPANSAAVRVFIDGALVITDLAPASSLNGFAWGDGFFPINNSGDAEWDHLKVEQTPYCAPDCEQDFDLDIFDYLCFLDEFTNSTPYGDCEKDGDWDLFDYLCFQGLFFDGCPM